MLTAVTALDFARDGVEMRQGLVAERDLRLVASDITLECAVFAKAGIRSLEKKFPSIARLAADPALLGVARELLGGEPRLVRAIFFDKTPKRNWAVPLASGQDGDAEPKGHHGWMGPDQGPIVQES
jgi:hypothetical protein